jgi:hypothetical protein
VDTFASKDTNPSSDLIRSDSGFVISMTEFVNFATFFGFPKSGFAKLVFEFVFSQVGLAFSTMDFLRPLARVGISFADFTN